MIYDSVLQKLNSEKGKKMNKVMDIEEKEKSLKIISDIMLKFEGLKDINIGKIKKLESMIKKLEDIPSKKTNINFTTFYMRDFDLEMEC